MINDGVNRSRNFQIKDRFSYIRSVSIIFKSHYHGYLICKEKRDHFGVKVLESHLIGGKVDMNDITDLGCGLREFCEETGLRINDEDVIGTMEILVSELKKCKIFHSDSCVSKAKNFYNRFIVIDLDSCENHRFLDMFITFVYTWTKKPNLPIEDLFFWEPSDPLSSPPSGLFTLFMANLPDSNLFV